MTSKGALKAFVAVVALAAVCALPAVASAAKPDPVQTDVSMTLQHTAQDDWQLYVENVARTPTAIRYVTWTAPSGLTIEKITTAIGGSCRVTNGTGITCTTELEPPQCPTCVGEGLTVLFKAKGFQGQWMPTSYGGYWLQWGWRPGAAGIIVSPAAGDEPVCTKGQTSTKTKPCSSV